MEKGDDILTQSLKNKYNKAIYNFEEIYLNEIYSNKKNNIQQEGYFINLKDFYELKEITNYKNEVENIKNLREENIALSDSEKIKIIKEKRFYNSQHLINLIYNDNQYILINKELREILCNKKQENENPILYKIKSNNIYFKLEDNKKLKFKRHGSNKNIIDKSTYKYENDKPNINEFKSIYKDIIEYYNFEKKISNNLHNYKKECLEYGYLVTKNWIDKWKKYSNYDNIKNKYLENNEENKHSIINNLINYHAKNKYNYSEILNIDIKDFKKNELESFLKTNSLVLISANFTNSINNPSSLNFIKYNTFNNKIGLFLNDGELYVNSNNNIISLNHENNKLQYINNNLLYLKQLIKIFYFQKELKGIINSQHKTIRNYEKSNHIYFINKKIINIYKNFFKFEEIIIEIEQNITKLNYDYDNLDDYFPKIIHILDENYINEISMKDFLDEFNDNDLNVLIKEIKPLPGILLEYINDFEIINEDIKFFFIEKKIIREEQMISGSFIAGDGKILINYNINNIEYYEIGHFDSNDIFINEYLIKGVKNQYKDIILNQFNENGIEKVIKKRFKKEGQIEIKMNNKKIKLGYHYKENINKNIQENDNRINNNKIQNETKIIKNQNYEEYKENENIKKNNNNRNSEIIESQNLSEKSKNKDVDSKKDENIIIDLLSFLVSMFLFEEELSKKIEEFKEESKNNESKKKFKIECYLIDKSYLLKIKELFSYEKIYKYIKTMKIKSHSDIEKKVIKEFKNENNKDLFKLILNKKEDNSLEQLKNKKFQIIEKDINEKSQFCYPKNFNIINKITYLKLLSLLNIDKDLKKDEENDLLLNLTLIRDKILLIPNKNNCFKENEENYFIYVYSLKKSDKMDLNYIPELILSFNDDTDRNNYFENILNREIKQISEDNNSQGYELIKLNNNENDTNIDKNKEKNKKKLKKSYAQYAIILYNEYKKLETVKSESNEKCGLYLISRKYMKNLELIINFKEVNKFIEKNILNESFLNFEDKEIIKEIMNYLKEKKPDIEQSKDRELQNNLNNNSIYELEKIEYPVKNYENKLFYYNNCQIINEKILNFIKEIDININNKIVKCYIYNDKLWICLNDNNINIGNLNNNIFIAEKIIYSKKNENIKIIIDYILNNDYREFSKFIINDIIKLNISGKEVKAKIFNLFKEEDKKEVKEEKLYEISEKLKILILLIINRNISFKNNNKIYDKIFLINENWGEHYKKEIKEINKYICSNENIKKKIEEINNSNFSLDSNYIDNLISNFNNKSLKKLDEKINNNNNKDIFPNINTKKIKLINNTIKIYKDFILLNRIIYDYVKNSFNNSINNQNIHYLSHNNNDVITIETKTQNTILIGNIEDKEIKYILDFHNKNYFEDEKNIIINANINNYIKTKMIFNENKQNDLISPILNSENTLIGYCYKYMPDIDYSTLLNHYNLLNNQKISNCINIYYNYKRLEKKIKTKNQYQEKGKYYLINKKIITQIKIDNNFKKIYELMDNQNIKEDDIKKIILSLKSLSNDEIQLYADKDNLNKNYLNDDIEPKITIVNNNDDNFMIYDNFELFCKDIIEKLIDNIDNLNNCYFECDFIEGKIIIHYQNIFNNNKYISVIGELNYEKSFVTEYVLIYKDKKGKKKHIDQINNIGLINYLNGLKLYNNSEPIFNNKYEEFGTIIKYEGNNINNINNNKKSNIAEINTKTTIAKNPKINISNIINDKENDDYCLNYRTDYPFIKYHFSLPPKIGLQNIGATCYMNATLQCFLHIEKFINFFKYSKQVIDLTKKNKNNLTASFKLLTEKLWPNKGKITKNYYAPEEFKIKISKMNSLFEGVAANDAKDLVNFIIMTLHEELNKADKNNNISNNIFLDQTNQQLMLNNFVQNFISMNKSIISDLFYGTNCNITQCGGCGIQTFNYQTYFFLVFPLEEVRKFKYNNIFNNFNNNVVTIYDCFEYDRKFNIMYGDNSMYCNYCKRNCNSSMCTLLTTCPEILILLLNRGKGNEFDVKIIFSELLNLYNYIQFNNSGFNYKLIGVITHIGESSMSGHFIAYCRDPIFNTWHKYNDAIVTDVNDFQKEVINFADPYLLFYQKIQ